MSRRFGLRLGRKQKPHKPRKPRYGYCGEPLRKNGSLFREMLRKGCMHKIVTAIRTNAWITADMTYFALKSAGVRIAVQTHLPSERRVEILLMDLEENADIRWLLDYFTVVCAAEIQDA